MIADQAGVDYTNVLRRDPRGLPAGRRPAGPGLRGRAVPVQGHDAARGVHGRPLPARPGGDAGQRGPARVHRLGARATLRRPPGQDRRHPGDGLQGRVRRHPGVAQLQAPQAAVVGRRPRRRARTRTSRTIGSSPSSASSRRATSSSSARRTGPIAGSRSAARTSSTSGARWATGSGFDARRSPRPGRRRPRLVERPTPLGVRRSPPTTAWVRRSATCSRRLRGLDAGSAHHVRRGPERASGRRTALRGGRARLARRWRPLGRFATRHQTRHRRRRCWPAVALLLARTRWSPPSPSSDVPLRGCRDPRHRAAVVVAHVLARRRRGPRREPRPRGPRGPRSRRATVRHGRAVPEDLRRRADDRGPALAKSRDHRRRACRHRAHPAVGRVVAVLRPTWRRVWRGRPRGRRSSGTSR